MELYLLKYLDEVADCEMVGEVKVYEIGDIRLEFPGNVVSQLGREPSPQPQSATTSESDLKFVFDWLYSCKTKFVDAQKVVLTAKLKELYVKWDDLAPGWCLRRI